MPLPRKRKRSMIGNLPNPVIKMPKAQHTSLPTHKKTYLDSSNHTLDWIEGRGNIGTLILNTCENVLWSLPGFLALGASVPQALTGAVVNSVVGRVAIYAYMKANHNQIKKTQGATTAGLPSEKAAVSWVKGESGYVDLLGTMVGRSLFQLPGFLLAGYAFPQAFGGALANSAIIEGSVLSKVTKKVAEDGESVVRGHFFLA